MAMLLIFTFVVAPVPAHGQDTPEPVEVEILVEDAGEAPVVVDDVEVGEEGLPEAPPPTPIEVPETDEEAGVLVGMLLDAISAKSWPVVAGLIMLLLVYLLRKVGLDDLVGAKLVPWVALGMALISTVGTGLVAGVSIADALVQGVLAGVTAIGGWELLFKHLLGQSKGDTGES